MQADAGRPINNLRVDGGAAANDLLMQIQADLTGVPVVRPRVQETTALGAAYLAGLATGVWMDTDEISARWQVERTFEPVLDPARAAERRARWSRAVARARGWEEAEGGP
jgi:glycerol kinase